MKNNVYTAIKLLISFTIFGGILVVGTSVVGYFDSSFSVSSFSLLSQMNFTALPLLALLAGIIFSLLSMPPRFFRTWAPKDEKTDGDDQLSD